MIRFTLESLGSQKIRLITIRDAEESLTPTDASLLKSLVSSGDIIAIERKHKQDINLKYNGGLIIASNFSKINKIKECFNVLRSHSNMFCLI